MHIVLPNGVESGIHHLVKVALSSMVALFGTYQIAANGLAQSIWSLASIMGLAMAPAYTTVIGQCMGAQDIESANFYFRKLNRHFRGSKIAGDLAGADKQYLQRAGISVCRSAGKRPAVGRGRGIHDAGFNLSDDRRQTVFLPALWPVVRPGRDRCRHRHERRSGLQGSVLHLALKIAEAGSVLSRYLVAPHLEQTMVVIVTVVYSVFSYGSQGTVSLSVL